MNSRGSFIRASQIENSNTLKSGFPALDVLIGELNGGQTYLFCGPVGLRFLDELVHSLIVRASISGNVAYMNNTDYYAEKTTLNSEKLAYYSKIEGIDYSHVLENVYFAAAYSEFRQPNVADALEKKIRQEPETKLLLAHQLPTFLDDLDDHPNAKEGLNQSLSRLWQSAMERKLIMVITTATTEVSTPIATGLMLELANVVVLFRGGDNGPLQALLFKHPAKRTPEVISIYGEEDSLGRITLPFRQKYQDLIEELRNNYATLLRNLPNKEAFELLIRDAWDREHAAMGNAGTPLVLDALNLTANIHNNAEIQRLKKALEEKERRIAILEERLTKLERAAGF